MKMFDCPACDGVAELLITCSCWGRSGPPCARCGDTGKYEARCRTCKGTGRVDHSFILDLSYKAEHMYFKGNTLEDAVHIIREEVRDENIR